MTRSIDRELELRLAQLEQENSALRSQVVVLTENATATDVGPGKSAKQQRAHNSRWRAPLASILVILGIVLAPVAVIASWANVQLTDTDRFVAAYAPLADDPAIQSAVIEQSLAIIDEQLEIDQLTSDVIDGVIDLGTGPAATTALQLLKGPASQGVRSLIGQSVERLVVSETFSDVWASTLRISHTQITGALQADGKSAVVLGNDGTIGIQLKPIIEAVKQKLVDEGITIADMIPPVDRTIQVAQSDSVAQIQLAYALTTAAGVWLPWVALLLIVSGVLVARKRASAMIAASTGLAVCMAALLLVFQTARMLVVTASMPQISSDALGVLFDTLTISMKDTFVAVMVTAIAVAIVVWLAGPFALPKRIRLASGAAAQSIRESLNKHGIHAGKFGDWLYAQQKLVRMAIAVVVALIILLVRPISAPLTIWTLVGAGVALLLLEIVQRPPGSIEWVDSEQADDEQVDTEQADSEQAGTEQTDVSSR